MAIRADRVGVREDQVDIHGRVTSPSFLNELLEDLPEWTDMPVWVNGTEELLPSNNSVPVTSPILADIAYPDIRRDNQYFTYRESPTTVDGLAKIKSIKGNTIIEDDTLISFNGTGIKTVGKNQFNKDTVVHKHFINGANISAVNPDLAHSDYISVLANTVYCSNIPNLAGVNKIAFYDIDKNLISFGDKVPTQWTTPSNCAFVRINMREEDVDSVYFNIGTDTTYEPYTSHTTNLPVSTYFPTGMKSAGTVYDELTPKKAITRVGAVDLGSLNWTHRTEVAEHIFSCDVTNSVEYKRQLYINFEIAKYNNGGTVIGVTDMLDKDDKTLCLYFTTNTGSRFIYIKDSSFNDATALKNSLQGIYLFYELATPVELPTMSFE